ncbi:MAG: cyanophycinase [Anaerolineae bacterium]|jgi:cyanophycinase|nr:cyanophycinase [Anaerolineae bacterium]
MTQQTLIAIGGAEDHTADRTILKQFVHLAGGDQARIVVITTASEIPDHRWQAYHDVFTALEVGELTHLDHRDRVSALDPTQLTAIDQATGIFITGGDQVQLVSRIGGTPIDHALHRAYQRGAIVAGTSAGAACLSQTMIAFGESGNTPIQGMMQLSAGLNFISTVIFDQHFRQRERLGRLITAVAFHPGHLGIGLDEDTALVIRDHQAEVIGTGRVTLVDGLRMESTIHQAVLGAPIETHGLEISEYSAGSSLTLTHHPN